MHVCVHTHMCLYVTWIHRTLHYLRNSVSKQKHFFCPENGILTLRKQFQQEKVINSHVSIAVLIQSPYCQQFFICLSEFPDGWWPRGHCVSLKQLVFS